MKDKESSKLAEEALTKAASHYRRVRRDEMTLYQLADRYNLKVDSQPVQAAATVTAEQLLQTIIGVRADGVLSPEAILSFAGIRA
jgi:hypothetical protein